MGRPLNKRLFGANALNNLKVQFWNGTASVAGFIVKQHGSKRFLCQDADGTRRLCRMVDKASADIAFGEMTFTVKYDNSDTAHPTKISAHLVTVNNQQEHWTFDPSTSDGYVQMEEAGTDDQLTDNTDLEGDGFSTLADYPTPDSGDVTSVADAIGTVTFTAQFETNEPSGGKTNSQVAGYGTGLRRLKYDGNFSTSGNMSSYSDWDFTFFSGQTVPPLGEVIDTKVNFGDQEDLPIQGGNHFSLQWVGYIKAPAAGDYNFYASSDDQVGLWIGSGAVDIAGGSGSAGTQFILGSAGLELGPGAAIIGGQNWGNYTVTMAADTWYPIVIWFGEFGGNCTCEIFAIESAGAKLAMKDFAFKYNPGSQGL